MPNRCVVSEDSALLSSWRACGGASIDGESGRRALWCRRLLVLWEGEAGEMMQAELAGHTSFAPLSESKTGRIAAFTQGDVASTERTAERAQKGGPAAAHTSDGSSSSAVFTSGFGSASRKDSANITSTAAAIMAGTSQIWPQSCETLPAVERWV